MPEFYLFLNAGVPFTERLSAFLTHPVIVPVLLSAVALGIIVELYTPGFGVAGILGAASLILFYFGHFAEGTAGFISAFFLIAGLVLVGLELFLPGGIAASLGGGAILISVLMAGDSLQQMALSVFIALVIALIGAMVLVKLFGRQMKLFGRIILSDSTSTESGYVSNVRRSDLIGQSAVTATALRPSGTVLLADERLDAVSESGFIAKGQKVKIVKTEGSWIVVRELEQEEEQ
ncbi:NfeD family protein [Indiicoccus explosivorum]|uniref:NfeD family protein n=1 Tax=Indiicoccus explosivorum TaxID=1917864 RepID=UPI000B445C0F|nr:NfeD family protein [Indiicoccus explosivorum]